MSRLTSEAAEEKLRKEERLLGWITEDDMETGEGLGVGGTSTTEPLERRWNVWKRLCSGYDGQLYLFWKCMRVSQ